MVDVKWSKSGSGEWGAGMFPPLGTLQRKLSDLAAYDLPPFATIHPLPPLARISARPPTAPRIFDLFCRVVDMRHNLKSADALPFDLIPLFFHWLVSPGDLASVALVCKTWNDAATARLYSTIVYSLELARQAGRVSTVGKDLPAPTTSLNRHCILLVSHLLR